MRHQRRDDRHGPPRECRVPADRLGAPRLVPGRRVLARAVPLRDDPDIQPHGVVRIATRSTSSDPRERRSRPSSSRSSRTSASLSALAIRDLATREFPAARENLARWTLCDQHSALLVVEHARDDMNLHALELW